MISSSRSANPSLTLSIKPRTSGRRAGAREPQHHHQRSIHRSRQRQLGAGRQERRRGNLRRRCAENGEKLARVRKTYRIDSRRNQGQKRRLRSRRHLRRSESHQSADHRQHELQRPASRRARISRGPDRNIIGGYDNYRRDRDQPPRHRRAQATTSRRAIHQSEKTSLPLVWAGIGGTLFRRDRSATADRRRRPASAVYRSPSRPRRFIRRLHASISRCDHDAADRR